jgi:hypothetical protein
MTFILRNGWNFIRSERYRGHPARWEPCEDLWKLHSADLGG